MPNRPTTSVPIISGLLTAQLIAFVQVHISNMRLYRKLELLSDTGFLLIPNETTRPLLQTFQTAWYGGFFFTLSVGAGITFLTLALIWIWKTVFHKSRSFPIVLLTVWMATIILVNWRDFLLMPTLYFVLVPCVVLFMSHRITADFGTRYNGMVAGGIHVAAIIFLAILWSTQMDGSLFINIRDNILLSNPLGRKINDFYYKYTLYPTQAFRSLNQRMIKTYHLSKMEDRIDKERLKRKLLSHDYFPVKKNEKPDIVVGKKEGRLYFKGRHRAVIEIDMDTFLRDSKRTLKVLSKKDDAYVFFRRATAVGFLLGFPILLYWLLYALASFGLSFFIGDRLSSIFGIAGCLLLGILLVIPVYSEKEKDIDPSLLSEMLASQNWKQPVSALKEIKKRQIDLERFQITERLMKHSSISVRYYLAQAFSVSKHPETCRRLASLMDDPHPNVACQAIHSMGGKKDCRAVELLIHKIKTSDHWYVQIYAYDALRKLGWKQKESG